MTILFCLLIVSAKDFLPRASAASAMAPSEACVEFIKKAEGFSAKPYYDYSQHTVGYGTKCPDDKYFEYLANGIPQEEAEILLLDTITDVADSINKRLMIPYGLSLSQHQFDALISFTFNLGSAWMTYDSSLRHAILTNANEDDLVYAFSLYCTAGGNYSSGLIRRRLNEANLYLNGDYSQNSGNTYGYVFYDPNGGSLTYRVQGFISGNNPLPVADAVRSGDTFLGWYTDLAGGSLVTNLNSSLTGKTLFARWQSSENPENQDSTSTILRVTGDVVNIRKGPGTNYGIAKQVYTNDVLILSHVTYLSNMKWGKVQDGWICLDYTNYNEILNGTGNVEAETTSKPSDSVTPPEDSTESDQTQTDMTISPGSQTAVLGTVRVNDLLRIRSGPGTAYATLGYLFNGNQIEILEQATIGTMVWGRFNRGWVSMNYIFVGQNSQAVTPTVPEPERQPGQETASPSDQTEPTAVNGIVIADALRIRPAPGATDSILGFYYQDDPVSISEKVLVGSVYWGKTSRGWISMDYIRLTHPNEEPKPSAGSDRKTVIADCLRVRKQIGTDSKIAALLYYGDQVTILETQTVNGTLWGRVDSGWICMDYVK